MKNYKIKIVFIKFSLLVLCICLLLFIFLKIFNKPKLSIENNNIEAPISSNISPNKNSKHNSTIEKADVLIENLVFKSKTNKDNPYIVIADKAIKEADGGSYQMDNILVKMGDASELLKIVSNEGIYDVNTDELKLSNKIISWYQGYKLTTDSLIVKLDSKHIIAPTKVHIENEKISIIADKLETEGVNIIKFEGNVKSSFNFDK